MIETKDFKEYTYKILTGYIFSDDMENTLSKLNNDNHFWNLIGFIGKKYFDLDNSINFVSNSILFPEKYSDNTWLEQNVRNYYSMIHNHNIDEVMQSELQELVNVMGKEIFFNLDNFNSMYERDEDEYI